VRTTPFASETVAPEEAEAPPLSERLVKSFATLLRAISPAAVNVAVLPAVPVVAEVIAPLWLIEPVVDVTFSNGALVVGTVIDPPLVRVTGRRVFDPATLLVVEVIVPVNEIVPLDEGAEIVAVELVERDASEIVPVEAVKVRAEFVEIAPMLMVPADTVRELVAAVAPEAVTVPLLAVMTKGLELGVMVVVVMLPAVAVTLTVEVVVKPPRVIDPALAVTLLVPF
jgi:hypothetical protein